MSSRQEEKDRRRREREEREQAERTKASSRRRLQLVAGGVLAVAAIAAVVAAIVSGGSDNKGNASADIGAAAIPAQKITGFDAAIKASGCSFKTYPSEGREHLASNTAVYNRYRTNPPNSGPHRPVWAQDGVYTIANTPDKENTVHALEHGRIEYQFAVGTPEKTIQQLNALFNEKLKGVVGYHQLLFQNQTKMPFAVAAVAWTHVLGCKTMNPQVFDAFRAFRERFVDKGPELIP
ncbi:DUF3105 domain-containing protein [Baekduia soli]|uniref:DUF3105 domain-containing protein n=1 Tax=Baekduia soli TaxID=496014 RepID=A0A5B8U1M0_9ACTN|nr:DUF3105 domain-containing protein [Baekduia soli]QEC46903.1 DUF3105 domain-containing protein [Baekduia soli]